MDFLLKKIAANILLPLPIALILLFIGLLFFWFSKKRLISGSFLSLGFLVLLIFSFSPLPNKIVNSLESQYQPIKILPRNIDDIVVLGGGIRRKTDAPPNTQLSSASLSRLIEGVRLYHLYNKQHQPVKLILSGGRVFGNMAEAGVMENIAEILGVKPSDIILEAGSRDTSEEAKYLKSQLQSKSFLLVTSAYHMPRAMSLFKNQGLHPIAAPTQYVINKDVNDIKDYIPNAKAMVIGDIGIHEYLGQLWARWHQKN